MPVPWLPDSDLRDLRERGLANVVEIGGCGLGGLTLVPVGLGAATRNGCGIPTAALVERSADRR